MREFQNGKAADKGKDARDMMKNVGELVIYWVKKLRSIASENGAVP